MRISLIHLLFVSPSLPRLSAMLPANFGWSSLVILAVGLLSMRPLWASAQNTTVVCPSQYHWVRLPLSLLSLSAVLTTLSTDGQ